MSVNLVVNGNTYAYPEQSDTNWGSSATDWAQAVTVGMLQKAGGLFQLLAEVDLGTTYGVKSVYFKSRTALPADAGQLRLAKTDVINWRNDANDGNNVLSVNSSNDLLWNGTSLAGIATVSDTSTIDLTVTSNNLTAAIIAGSITNAYINASAAIAFSKLATLTVSRALVSDGSGFVSASSVTATELGYVSGVTSSIQTQLNALQPSGSYITALTGNVVATGPGSVTATIQSGVIVNSMVSASAAIAYSKLALTGSIVNADVNASAAVAYSKLNLTGSIVNADIGASAAIAFSKLAALTSGNILVGSAGNVATSVAVTGDISLSNAGVTAYAGTVPLNKGGTGQTTKAPAFDALSPMTTSGDIIYGGASGTGTRLAKGTDGQVLTLASGLPSWATASASGANTALSNLASVAINTTLVSDTDLTDDLGTSSINWRRLYVQNIYRPGNVEIIDLANQRLNDSSGNSSVYLDAHLLRTGLHAAPVTKLDWSGTTDIIVGNSAGVIKINTSLVPTTADVTPLGTTALRLSNICSNQYQLYSSGSATTRGAWNPQITTPSGATADSIRTTVAGALMAIWGASDSNVNATKAGGLLLEGGNKTAGTGDGGDVKVWTGTSAGGARGALFLKEKTFAGASVGDVLKLLSTSTGEVGFAAGGGGANTALSNLASTAVNADINPGTAGLWNLGSDTLTWAGVWTEDLFVNNAIKDLDGIEAISISSGARSLDFGNGSGALNFSDSSIGLIGYNDGQTFSIGGTRFTDQTQIGNTAATETDAFDNIIFPGVLSANGQALEIDAAGTFANTISVDKRIKVKFGSTTLFDSGNIAASAGGSWSLRGRIVRTGSSAQKAIFTLTTNVSGILSTAQYNTAAEDLTSALHIKLTLNGTNANDTVGEFFIEKWSPTI